MEASYNNNTEVSVSFHNNDDEKDEKKEKNRKKIIKDTKKRTKPLKKATIAKAETIILSAIMKKPILLLIITSLKFRKYNAKKVIGLVEYRNIEVSMILTWNEWSAAMNGLSDLCIT